MPENTKYLGFIGGSGLEDLMSEDSEFQNVKRIHNIFTPYGRISELQVGELEGNKVYFISRHGRGREYSPNEAPYKAYLWLFANLKIIDPFLNEVNGIPELQQKDYQLQFPSVVGEKGVDLRENNELNFKLAADTEKTKADHVFAFSATGSFDEKIKLGNFVLIDSISRGLGNGPQPLPYKDMPHPVPEIAMNKKGIEFLAKIGDSLGLEMRHGPYILNTWSEAFETGMEVALFQAVPRLYEALILFVDDLKNGNLVGKAIYHTVNFGARGGLDRFYKRLKFPGFKYLTSHGMQAGMTAHDAILGTQFGLNFNTIACPVNWGVGMDPEDFGRPITPYLRQTLEKMHVDFDVVNHELTTKVMEAYAPHIKRFAAEIVKNYNSFNPSA